MNKLSAACTVGFRVLAWVGIGLVLALVSEAAWARRVALLVGIGSYAQVEALEGPAHDLDAMRAVLMRRWGFAPGDVVVLKDAQATRAAILRELWRLQEHSASGDEVLVYFSGHGTSAIDAAGNDLVPHGSGAFVPHDFGTSEALSGSDGLIVGRRDLVPLLLRLDASGRRLWVISDSCYSGQQVRSLRLPETGRLPARMIPMVPSEADRAALDAKLGRAQAARRLPPYPYRHVAFLSASAEGEVARDVPATLLDKLPTVDNKPHGALTDALLRVLEGRLPADYDGDGLLSLVEVHRAVSDFMARRAYGHTPQRLPSVAEDEHGVGQRAVLSQRGAAAPVQRAEQEPLRVRVEGPAGKPLPGAHQRALRELPGVQLLGAQERGADLVLRHDERELQLLAASGDLLRTLDLRDGGAFTGQISQLAWARRLQQLGEQNRRAALPFEVDPAAVGGNFRIGEKLAFVVRPDREATVVLLNVNAEGGVSVLYPYNASERRPLPAQVRQFIPPAPQRIEVGLPEGMDLQFAIAFDAQPADLDWLTGLRDVPATDGRFRLLEEALRAMKGRFTFAVSSTRTLRP